MMKQKVEDSGYFTHEQMSHGLVKSGKKCTSRCWNDCAPST